MHHYSSYDEPTSSGRSFKSSSPCLDEIVRRRTPIWIGRLLKTNIDDTLPLEELFANCWVLGRLADAIVAILDQEKAGDFLPNRTQLSPGFGITDGESPGGSRRAILTYQCPPQNLGERPYKAMIQDYEKFTELCNRLDIKDDSRFTLTDVEQKRAGEKIGLCVWDICNALHDKSATGELPEYVGRSVPKFNDAGRLFGRREQGREMWDRARSFERVDGRESPLKFPGQKLVFSASSPNKRKDSEEDMLDDLPDEMDASTRILSSILTPNKNKPRHAKLLNAVMMSDFDTEEGEEAENVSPLRSPLPRIVDRHEASPSPSRTKAAVEENDYKRKYKEADYIVNVSKFNSNKQRDESGSEGKERKSVHLQRWMVLIPCAAAALVSFLFMKTRQQNPRRPRYQEIHGRW